MTDTRTEQRSVGQGTQSRISSGPEGQGLETLKTLLQDRDPAFATTLRTLTRRSHRFEEILPLITLRKKAERSGIFGAPEELAPLRIALAGGCSLYPLHETLTHFLAVEGFRAILHQGDYDNYHPEIMDEQSGLYSHRPELLFLIPSLRSCSYQGSLLDSSEMQRSQAMQKVEDILGLCKIANQRSGAEIVLSNFLPPAHHDLGPYKTRTLGSEWSFRRLVNLELGLRAPPYVHICDTEFLASRTGTLQAFDPRAWFESKQPFSPNMTVAVAREMAHIAASLRKAPKKVLVLDLDNTVWGGVIGDDGLEGIEIGDTSPRGEAFKAFQAYCKSLIGRGVLLAVCSKNDHEKAVEPFDKHPEMVLRLADFVSFKANWNPKSENIRDIARELNLGLDSIVFVDDNPAEVEIVRQFTPEVETILVGEDPSEFVPRLQESRLFEPRSLTSEDAERTAQYRREAERNAFQTSCTDMDSYLRSLEMKGSISEFALVDVPRLFQLINKSNQFNLTTRRRTESEVQSLILSQEHVCFSVRLQDKFGDHGLIAIVIGEIRGAELEVDTWLMSCRVLKRQVEEVTLNEIARLALAKGCSRIRGVYLPTAKNEMVKDLYPRLGFSSAAKSFERLEFVLELHSWQPKITHIHVLRRSYESN